MRTAIGDAIRAQMPANIMTLPDTIPVTAEIRLPAGEWRRLGKVIEEWESWLERAGFLA